MEESIHFFFKRVHFKAESKSEIEHHHASAHNITNVNKAEKEQLEWEYDNRSRAIIVNPISSSDQESPGTGAQITSKIQVWTRKLEHKFVRDEMLYLNKVMFCSVIRLAYMYIER